MRPLYGRHAATTSPQHFAPCRTTGRRSSAASASCCRPYKGRIPAFIFHGFSRSAGLLPEIFALGGYVSIGPALLNDHAVNYRVLAKELPLEWTLVETDMDYSLPENDPDGTLRQIVSTLAALRGESDSAQLEAALTRNATTVCAF